MHEPSDVKPLKYNSTSGSKSPYVWTNLGVRGCGSEQAPLIMHAHYIFYKDQNIMAML